MAISRRILAGIFLAANLLFSHSSAFAADSDFSPIGIGLFPPLQLPDTGYGIRGLRLGVVNKNRQVQGLDIGLLGNMTDVKFGGVAIAGLFNYNHGLSTVTGLQLAAIANLNSGPSKIYGLQIAAYNHADDVYGLQLGLVNVANNLHGVQIGLFNINHAGPFKGAPIINVGF